GDNHIEFEASVPASADATCDPRQQIEGPQRFVLSDRSTIRFPNLARLAHLPNLRSTMASGFPYVGTGVATSLHLPAMNEATLSSAAALTTRMALAAGQPLALSIKRGMPDETTGNAIVIATLDDIQPQVSQRLPGVSDKALRTAWRVPSVFDGDTAIAFNAHAGGIDHTLTGSVTTDTPVEAPASDPLAAFARTEGNTSAPQNTSIVRRLLSMGSPVPVATSNFDPVTSSAVISQALAPNDGTAVWTVVTAATDDDLQSGVEALIDPASIVALDGATASFSGADGTLTSSIAKGQYVPVEWTTFANTRRVLQGWFAQNQHVYTIIMVLLLGGLGAVTNLCVRRSGPSSSRKEDRAV
ncbi:MAG: cellulose biosynthesis cyclic di-GMP-binding regulatory protein BcsB, partial [Pseudomonadota bacterium]